MGRMSPRVSRPKMVLHLLIPHCNFHQTPRLLHFLRPQTPSANAVLPNHSQSLHSMSSLALLRVYASPLQNLYTLSSSSHRLASCVAYVSRRRVLNTASIFSIPNFCLNSSPGTLSSNFRPHIHLIILISSSVWSQNHMVAHSGHLSHNLATTQQLYNNNTTASQPQHNNNNSFTTQRK